MSGVSLVAAQKTRDVLWGVPHAAEVGWYALIAVSVAVFAFGVLRPVAKYRHGQAIWLPPIRELPRRLRAAAGTLFSHVSIKRRDPYIGWAHGAMFYGFIVLFLGTVVLGVNSDVTEPLFGWRFFKGNFYLVYSVILDVFGLALLCGVAMAIVRRALIRPRKLDYARPDRPADHPAQARAQYRVGDWVFVAALSYLVLTGFVLEGVRIAMDNPGYNAFSPVGWVAAQGIGALGFGQQGLRDVRHVLWWSHGVVALAFVASIPYTKAAHMLTSFASLVLRDDRAGKRLRPLPASAASDPAGYGQLSDFSIQHLLQLDACTKCGKCHEACPANATGKPLSPRDVVLELREEAIDAFDGVGVGGILQSLLQRGGGQSLDVGVIGPDRVAEDTLWSCMQCNACVEVCPVGIEQAPMINQMRRRLVEDAEMPAELASTLQVIHRAGNSFGESKRKRGRWTRELDFEIKDARKEAVDILWFVGDYASFDPRSQETSRALARLLAKAGVDFGILYDGEANSGNDVRRVGEEGLFEALAEQNIESLDACEFSRIITSDPHSLNTLRNEYPDFGGSWNVIHHTAYLLELMETRRLPVPRALNYRVTYHDPCYLGRHNGEYDDPRRILELLGCELIEMPRNRDNSFCCGAGGGRIWINDAPGTERPSENRVREAVALGKLDFFVVTCPKDATMFGDAIKTSGNADRIAIREITELLEEAVIPA